MQARFAEAREVDAKEIAVLKNQLAALAKDAGSKKDVVSEALAMKKHGWEFPYCTDMHDAHLATPCWWMQRVLMCISVHIKTNGLDVHQHAL